MAAALKIVDGGSRSPEREALAAAIAEAADYKATADATRAGVARAKAMIEDASSRLSAATADASAAKEAHTARAIEAASTGATLTPDASLREARVRADDARDDLEAAEAALAAVEASLGDDLYRERKSLERVGAAADMVIQAGPVEALLEEAERIHRDLTGRRNVLILLTTQLRAWQSDGSHNRAYSSTDTSLPARIDKFLGTSHALMPTTMCTPRYDECEASSAWLKAREALLTDPDAALPG